MSSEYNCGYIGHGKLVHAIFVSRGGKWHLCGSGRTVRGRRVRLTSDAVTCKRCLAIITKRGETQLFDQHAEDTQAIGNLLLENAKLRETLTGCADMLNECARQFRKLDQPGHAAMADAHQHAARAVLARAAEGGGRG